MLILLDIDGVMVPAAPWKKPEFLDDGFPAFSPKAVISLQKILIEVSTTIVLTTSHKFKYTLPQWYAIFKKRGIKVASLDRTEDNTTHLSRKEEILNWVNTNPSVKDFIIIDDDKSLNGLPFFLKDKLILTSPMIGLTEEHATLAINIGERFGIIFNH